MKSSPFLAAAALAAILATPVSAQFHEATRKDSSAGFEAFPTGPFPNVELPEQVKAAPGQLTIFTDFDHPEEWGIPIYYINRTNKSVNLPDWNGPNPMFLEVKDEKSETWRRAQAKAMIRECGVMGDPRIVEPGLFFRTHGYVPAKGKRGMVRYRDTGWEMASNEAPGLWLEKDVVAAATDMYSARQQPFLGSMKISTFVVSGHLPKPELGAITADDIERNLAMLDLSQNWERDLPFHSVTKAMRQDLQSHPAFDREFSATALQRLEQILAKATDHPADGTRLHKQCLLALHAEDRSGFATPARFPEYAWDGIAFLGSKKQLMTLELWKESYDILQRRLPKADQREQRAMASLVFGNPSANELLGKDFLLKGASPAFPGFREACLERLSSRMCFSELAALAEAEDIGGKLLILPYLCLERKADSPPTWQRIHDDTIQKIWTTCIREDLAATVRIMHDGVDLDRSHADPWLAKELQTAMDRLLESATAESWQPSFHLLDDLAEMIGQQLESSGSYILRARGMGDARPEGETEDQILWRRKTAERMTLQLRENLISRGEEEPE